MTAVRFEITEQDIRGLGDVIKKHATAPGFSGPTLAEFCAVWPEAKKGLALLEEILGKIPSIALLAKVIISAVIIAGDTACDNHG